MNVLPPNGYKSKKYNDDYARATEFIDQQVEMVKNLLEKGFAYQTKQAIYFDVTKLPDYGILSGQRLADKEVGARNDVVTDPEKHNPHDFAVWFFTVGHFEAHSMQWESPWGNGFPGWHLECSAIIHATLGDPIDIHTGGVDHIGTHHPNEMAQTEAAFGHPLAHFWVHNEFILVDGVKMSKSKNNSYTLKDITDKGFDPLAYRLLVLQAHYRSELNFSWENLEAAQNRLKALQAFADLKWQPSGDYTGLSEDSNNIDVLLTYLKDDLDTPMVLAVLSGYANVYEKELVSQKELEVFNKLLKLVDQLLGLNLGSRADISDEQKKIIKERQDARLTKDWVKSDMLRDRLLKQGIAVRDTANVTIWSRV